MTVTLMLTSTGGVYSAQTIMQASASTRHDVRVVAVDAGDKAAAVNVADVFARVPFGSDPEYVDRVCDVIKREKVDLVVPCSDEEALTLSAARQQVENVGATLACTDADTLAIFADKMKTYNALGEAGIAVADWRYVETVDEFEAAFDELLNTHGEVAVRPAVSRGGRDVFVIRKDLTEIESYLGGFELHMNLETFRGDHVQSCLEKLPLIVAERLTTPAYDADILAWQGEAVHVVPRRRLDHTGNSLGYVVGPDPEIEDMGRRLAKLFNLTWLYDVDLMTNMAGRPCIVEINPRPSGSFSMPIAAGVPILDDLISLYKGEAVQPFPVPVNKRVVPYNGLYVVEDGKQQGEDGA
ncbi:MAG: ATP-grasp domain-containing protein [Rhodospirillaceae bacterium]|jgi:carbamoyl-phosphate synthase large subunit|nr:ATP-grasp domain-containing protein [Rhodospirillaceae bacterium]MBT4219294.1 ATP-grasp domain-containing protein [Rhodospirillaceae bacterium]MBT4464962.1 ATP-grasp domain-containing protein [Rhodospirillaceae bacterium]MBT5013153.1 ATP-grasp domain-containing protein [Rhodospirillaceae bacterium]MBT5307828.1 ATP-grasp domain-containing protein [Rhodospirillaceae bacterium]